MRDIPTAFKSLLLTGACILLTGCVHRAELRPYVGQWVLRSSGKNMAVLTTKMRSGRIVGTLVIPHRFHESSTGSLSEISLPIVTQPVMGRWTVNSAEFVFGRKPERNFIEIAVPKNNQMLLNWFHGYVPRLMLDKVANEPKVKVATTWQMVIPSPSPDQRAPVQ